MVTPTGEWINYKDLISIESLCSQEGPTDRRCIRGSTRRLTDWLNFYPSWSSSSTGYTDTSSTLTHSYSPSSLSVGIACVSTWEFNWKYSDGGYCAQPAHSASMFQRNCPPVHRKTINTHLRTFINTRRAREYPHIGIKYVFPSPPLLAGCMNPPLVGDTSSNLMGVFCLAFPRNSDRHSPPGPCRLSINRLKCIVYPMILWAKIGNRDKTICSMMTRTCIWECVGNPSFNSKNSVRIILTEFLKFQMSILLRFFSMSHQTYH